jgi:hypothetical protein
MGSDCAPFDTQMHRVLALSFLGVLKGIAEWGGFMGVLTVMGEGYEGFLMLGYQKSSPPIPLTHHSQRPMNFLSLALLE